MKIRVLIIYSKQDPAFLTLIRRWLAPMVQTEDLEILIDQDLPAGGAWEKWLAKWAKECQIALILVSRALWATPYVVDTELPALLERAQRGEVILFPILVDGRENIADKRLLAFQFGNSLERPLVTLSQAELEREFETMTKRFLALIASLRNRTTTVSASSAKLAAKSIPETHPGFGEPSWARFAEDFRRFLKDPESGMLLNADAEYRRQKGIQGGLVKAAFKLSGKKFYKEFITLWELFDHRKMFESCLERIVEMARRIYAENPFSQIVTCTSTGRELGANICERLVNANLPVEHIHFPYPPLRENDGHNNGTCRGEQVLFLTDVISTGALSKRMIDAVARMGGDVCAVLTFVVTDPKSIARAKNGLILPPPETNAPKTDDDVVIERPIYYLTDYPIPRMADWQAHNGMIIEIDFATVLPKVDDPRSVQADQADPFRPKILTDEAFEHFDSTAAIRYGLFLLDEAVVTCIYHFRSLLTTYREKIWQGAKEILGNRFKKPEDFGSALLLSSYKREDLEFKYWLEDMADQEGWDAPSSALTIKRETHDSPLLYYTLHPYQNGKIEGRDVVVAMASNTSSEKLRGIVGLLAAHGAASVTVLCLFSRMGPYTHEMMNQIGFLRRMEKDRHFTFGTIYSVHDLPNEKINSASEELREFFAQHAEYSLVAQFSRLSEIYGERFVPGRVAMNWATMRGSEPTTKSEFQTVGAEVAYHLDDYARSRDFKHWHHLLVHSDTPEILNLGLLILISDVGLHRLNGNIRKSAADLIARLRDLRQQRFKAEEDSIRYQKRKDAGKDEDVRDLLRTRLRLEMEIQTMLAVLSHFDDSIREMISVAEFVGCRRSAEDWMRTPMNCKLYFENERFAWNASLLMTGGAPGGTRSSTKDPTEPELIELLKQIKSKSREVFAEFSSRTGSTIGAIRANINALFRDLGIFILGSRADVVRHLQSTILEAESSVAENIFRLVTCSNNIERYFSERDVEKPLLSRKFRSETVSELHRCLNRLPSLQDTGKVIRQFLLFASTGASWALRFLESRGQSTFSFSLAEIQSVMTKAAKREGISYRESQRLKEAVTSVSDDLCGENSPFIKTLRSFSVPISQCMEEALEWVEPSQEPGLCPWTAAWREERQKNSEGERALVLIDTPTLVTVFKGVMASISACMNGSAGPNIAVSRTHLPAGAGDEVDAWCVQFGFDQQAMDLEKFHREVAILQPQRAMIEAYGGGFSADEKSNFPFRITLIER